MDWLALSIGRSGSQPLEYSLGSYTDGYNAIIEDEEYDLDRYQEDSEYRKGVDDAMEELDEYY